MPHVGPQRKRKHDGAATPRRALRPHSTTSDRSGLALPAWSASHLPTTDLSGQWSVLPPCLAPRTGKTLSRARRHFLCPVLPVAALLLPPALCSMGISVYTSFLFLLFNCVYLSDLPLSTGPECPRSGHDLSCFTALTENERK